ncbi:hypothetical protein [Lentilitoribacter sp. EG35]
MSFRNHASAIRALIEQILGVAEIAKKLKPARASVYRILPD